MKRRGSHRKSKNGCLVCKKRKIKCDELKPRCTNCIEFRVPCSFDSTGSVSGDIASLNSSATEVARAPLKRSRGRPRKDWRSVSQSLDVSTGESSTFLESIEPAVQLRTTRITRPQFYPLNVDDLELLIHFIAHTGPSLAHPVPADNTISRFWSRNVPQIGLSCHTVLHLALSLAAHHLAYSTVNNLERCTHYISLASHHGSLGLVGLTKALQTINDSTCGAVYLCATLVSFCTFAAGPTDLDDLLVCNVGNSSPQRWMSVVQGVRLIRKTFEPSILFSGLMSPIGPSEGEPIASSKPRCIEDGFPRIDWEQPLRRLQDLIISSDSPDVAGYLEAHEMVESIYNATYGKDDGSCNCEPRFKFVFIWLYAIDNGFVTCLQQKKPLSLLVLAYYALLLTTMKRDWFIQRWSGHLLLRVRDLLGHAYVDYLRWPLEQAGLFTVESHTG
ncbi:hypothetical protein BJX99DRAFT_254159 [Aspergillus californicus]